MFVKGFKQDRFPSSWSLMEGDTAGAWVAGRETSRQGGLEAGPKRVLSACWEGAWGPPAFPRMPSVFFLTSGESLRELWVSQCHRLSYRKIHLQCWRPGFDPWVGKIPWRRERLPTPVFWPGEFHGLYSPWGRKESDTTERLSLSLLGFPGGSAGKESSCSAGDQIGRAHV